MLPRGLTAEALAAAMTEADPDSLAAGQRMRARFGSDLAAAALTQAALRRQAVGKFGDRARELFFTRDGLEQATRPTVAAYHAERFSTAGADEIVDLGCGIGSDALAFVAAGLTVRAVELDPTTAEVAAANLRGRAEVRVADATAIELGDIAVFADPARRTAKGRSWRLEDLNPPWGFVLDLLRRSTPTGVKLGPGVPHAVIPDEAEAEWVSHGGDTVEAVLWAGAGASPGARVATLLSAAGDRHRLVSDRATERPQVGEVGRYLLEPDGAVIRAGSIPELASAVTGRLLATDVAYLACDTLTTTPFATAYEVDEVLPWRLPELRRWVRRAQIGVLEIKKRGIRLDPAELRRQLRPAGEGTATLIITRTPTGAVALSSHRV